MGSVKIHVAELCSRLHEFHQIKKVTDVTIHCEGRQFLCHRAVLAAKSTYFECMFRNGWTENVTGSVTFDGDHMKADTLLEVLKYIYAGNAAITSSNFLDLLYADDYLGVLGLEAYCIQKLSKVGPELIDDLWEALFSTHSIFNESIISVLASCNLTERLKSFFNKKEFLHIPADLLTIIVTRLWRSRPTMNDILLGAIYRWRDYALHEREEHARKLHKRLKPAFENSSPRVTSELEKTVAVPECPSLYVYARDMQRTTFKVNTYRYNCEDPSDKKFVLEYSYQPDPPIRDLQLVSVKNVGLFSIANALEKDYSTHSTLFQFASENIHGFQSGLALAPPPINTSFESFGFCNLSDRGLYLLNTGYVCSRCPPSCRNLRYDASKQAFSEEEVARGMFFFNIELDRWLPVPAMKYNPRSSCMTVLDNNMVYVFAGRGSGKIVQAYDHRMRQWQQMPKTLGDHIRPQSCVLNGSIYVSSSRSCERYDPVASRWEEISAFQKDFLHVRRLIPYKNKLWYSWTTIRGAYTMEVLEPRTAKWSVVQSTFPPMGPKHFLDAVIW